MRETTPSMDWCERYLPELGDLQSGGSVATSVFDLMLNLGCDPIILIGQDLAYTGREIHSAGTHHNDDWLPKYTRFLNLDTINQRVIRKRSIKYVEAVGGGTVITDFVLDLYRHWFEDSAAKVAVTVINATEGGARIANTREQTLASVTEALAPKKTTPAAILASKLGATSTQSPRKLLDAIAQALADITFIANLVNQGTAGPAIDVAEVIEQKGLMALYAPFLKKTRTYVIRHNFDQEKSNVMLLKEVREASKKLSFLLEKCRADILQMSGKSR
jgi:hypothetical protein